MIAINLFDNVQLHFRVYHTKAQLTEALCEASELRSPDDGGLCMLLARLPGVEKAFLNRYKATVFIGDAWTWEEVEPKILEVSRPDRVPGKLSRRSGRTNKSGAVLAARPTRKVWPYPTRLAS